uniref:Uncharacterized protein n=1 Tax=Biomphalaria glabrata TaxID=6526 RepID=A0A2C9M447_BIOGL
MLYTDKESMMPTDKGTKMRGTKGSLNYEVTYRNKEAQENSASSCTKNPGHEGFIFAENFSIESLPESFRTPKMYELCRCLINLTCMIEVFATSKNRSASDNFKDQLGARIGSGSVYIPLKYTHKGGHCPCPECKDPKNAGREFYEVYVTTAHHVVFDNYEARRTYVKLHFDREDKKESTVTLPGYRIVNYNAEADRTILSCITHDIRIVKEIQKQRDSAKEFEEYFCSHPLETNPSYNLTVIVGHPHRWPKTISFGSCVQVQSINSDESNKGTVWTEYKYNAPTCPGSSGALVWIYGKKRVGYRDSDITTHTHCGSEDGMNKSGLGLEFKTP